MEHPDRRKDAWNKGYGLGRIVLLRNWLFNHRGLHRIWLTVQSNNPRAMHVYEKVGFAWKGTSYEHNVYDGRWHDDHLYGSLTHEFNARYRPERTAWVVSGEQP